VSDTVRIGSVPHLNVYPLVYGIEDRVEFIRPAPLADGLARGEFDVGLVPVVAALEHPEYDVLDDVAVASHGAVRSVYLAHRGPRATLRRVAVTPYSRTSVWLLRVLLRVVDGNTPAFDPLPDQWSPADHDAVLLIGDEALKHAHQGTAPGTTWDLGAAWHELTGLPFVYAVWAGRHGVFAKEAAPGRSLGQLLREARATGLAHREQIVQHAAVGDADLRRAYLTRHIQHGLGFAEKEGIRRFQRYLVEQGLVAAAHDLRYVS
jgi:chorismate dehydratase